MDDLERNDRARFDDGNIVVFAGSIAFRVHRSVLSLHSDVLRNTMSALSTTMEGRIDGCPVVRLNDSANNVCRLLCA